MIIPRKLDPGSPVISLRLFGSMARTDADANSDLDILVVLSSSEGFNLDSLKRNVERLFDSIASLSVYSQKRMAELFRQGHLFAWHIYLESLPITMEEFSDWVEGLGRPAYYSAARKDIESLVAILKSIGPSVMACPRNRIYEAGLMYVCLRNIALCASWHSPRGLDFSRQSPFAIEQATGVSFPISSNDYAALTACRMSGQRGAAGKDIELEKLLSLWRKATEWSNEITNFVGEARDERGFKTPQISPADRARTRSINSSKLVINHG